MPRSRSPARSNAWKRLNQIGAALGLGRGGALEIADRPLAASPALSAIIASVLSAATSLRMLLDQRLEQRGRGLVPALLPRLGGAGEQVRLRRLVPLSAFRSASSEASAEA